jgi:hypothetical protein
MIVNNPTEHYVPLWDLTLTTEDVAERNYPVFYWWNWMLGVKQLNFKNPHKIKKEKIRHEQN